MRKLLTLCGITAALFAGAASGAAAQESADVLATYTAWGPGRASSATYNNANNHYVIRDRASDNRAVAVIFQRANGVIVGFQSCHEGAGQSCPGDLPRTVTGRLYMRAGVGLGPNPTGYRWGAAVVIPNA
ncbi:hypothetical protein [Kibdelosporangium aridum]|uniref:hypothetical protein n=1 Tax=Kibdelosporangium aridum TaxID=2030 RepID=UPI0005241B2D